MGRHFRLPFALLWLAGLAGEASGQVLGLPRPVAWEASMRGGRVEGTVTDQAGAALDGVTVVAIGTALSAARTDLNGRFTLPLPAGDYVLRATRDGYVSNYREPVRIVADLSLRRHITLLKAVPVVAPKVLLAGVATGEPTPDPANAEVPDERVEGDAAWRLRHLPRTVLRDAGPIDFGLDELQPHRFGERGSLVDWMVAGSAHAATSFITDTNFNGQVNLLTTSAMPSFGPMTRPSDWSRGVAYFVLGAPVGEYGDWSVRGAAASGDLRSWTLLTEYRAQARRSHAFRTGLAYSSQEDLVPDAPLSPTNGRRVGGIYVLDRWTMGPNAVVDYGGRLDRYDYLSTPVLASGHLGFAISLMSHARMTWAASSRMIAPGADQFLPPSTSGPWLPPERTFSSLRSRTPLQPEEAERFEVGFEADLGRGRVISVRRFSEATRDQIVTLFGLDAASQVGHYYIGSAGDVFSDGWTVGFNGAIAAHVTGGLEYAVRDADWLLATRLAALKRVSPSSVRAGGSGHDLTASLDATVPRSATRVSLSLRFSDEFSAPSRDEGLPVAAGRFKLEIQQQLPYQPLHGGQLNFVIAVRTLLRDVDAAGSVYDELLTVRPPLRLTSGVQMRF